MAKVKVNLDLKELEGKQISPSDLYRIEQAVTLLKPYLEKKVRLEYEIEFPYPIYFLCRCEKRVVVSKEKRTQTEEYSSHDELARINGYYTPHDYELARINGYRVDCLEDPDFEEKVKIWVKEVKELEKR